jgi:hypothetical protein
MEIDVRHMKEAPLTLLKHTFGEGNYQQISLIFISQKLS